MSSRTAALVVQEAGAPFTLQTIDVHPLRPDEALVEIHASGVCHTDLSCASGLLPAKTPAVFGHEGAGIVLEVGADVEGVAKDDKVLMSYSYCSDCEQCKSGHVPYCEKILPLNFGGERADGSSALSATDGGKLYGHFFGQSCFAQLAVVHKSSLVKVPQDVPLSLFAPLGCGVQTGAGAILNSLNVQPGSTVAVFGVGSVGLSAIMASKMRGAREIIAVDIQDSRLEIAKSLGATATINSKDVNVVDAIRKLCPPNGVQFALDCSGVPQVVETMVNSLGARGRACSVGAPAPDKTASINIFQHLVLGREYVGCHQGASDPRKMALYLIEQQRQGRFPLEKLIKTYDYRDFQQALDDTKSGRTIKAVLTWK
ncbi:hypothetical protein CAC42_2661 [Sphaceloma murrayae]|uniref:Enoyl reductase (ER) domain-containing protein n=1 Tax=Sphaceloma murrayae TaxID=2082308 RepID=A0A2K1QHH8_9PEZI|nr:hypothetical protein CAC42_2661 [Sphaceloma murrayae]